MTKNEAIGHFGSVAALAKALSITTQAIYDWGRDIPVGRQYQIQVITNGQLKAETDANTQVA